MKTYRVSGFDKAAVKCRDWIVRAATDDGAAKLCVQHHEWPPAVGVHVMVLSELAEEPRVVIKLL